MENMMKERNGHGFKEACRKFQQMIGLEICQSGENYNHLILNFSYVENQYTKDEFLNGIAFT